MGSNDINLLQMAVTGFKEWLYMATTVVGWIKMVSNERQWLQMALTDVEWEKMTSNAGECWEMAPIDVEWVKMASNGHIWQQLMLDGSKWS